jgi:hypothetical protein
VSLFSCLLTLEVGVDVVVGILVSFMSCNWD